MKIAFDGTVLHGPKSGVGYYCEELLKAMLAKNHEHQFFVFSHQPLNVRLPVSNGNLKFTNSAHCPIRAFYLHALLPKVLDKVQPDLCHYTNFLAPISEDRPYVVTIHDMSLEVLSGAHPLTKRLYTKRLIPHVARKARLVITNSEYSKWEIVRYLGIPEDRIRVTPLAASPEFKPISVRPAGPYFLYVGNLEPRKNLERLIEAFARIPAKQHRLLIAGNRWYHGGAAERKARSLGLNGRVKFLGYVPRADLPGLFSGATAFVYPSLLEGFGLPIVEAMACGAPVITSNNSSMTEVAAEAALLVDPRDVRQMTDALTRVAEDEVLRNALSARGLKRAAEFSWERTAELTLDVYREVVDLERNRVSDPLPPSLDASPYRARASRAALLQKRGRIDSDCPPLEGDGREAAGGRSHTRPQVESFAAAIRKTVEYGKLFQYPLKLDELRERLFDVEVDQSTFERALESLQYQADKDLLALRAEREKISDQAIQEVQPHLHALASIPFIRMIAFSGATAHRNMNTTEDVDLFMVVEDGKLWAVFLMAIVWAKAKGLRKRLCMNYAISDAALPLYEHDVFTAQQTASLKPVYGKSVYDLFIAANPFVRRCFPNFDPARHRNLYQEIQPGPLKGLIEAVLRMGPIQIVDCLSRAVLGRYLSRKATEESEIQLDARRLKLHLRGHKNAVLQRFDLHAGSRVLAPTPQQSHQ